MSVAVITPVACDIVKDLYNPAPQVAEEIAARPRRLNEPLEDPLMPGVGKVTQVIGSTFDAEFPEDQLPSIYNAVTVDQPSGRLTGEVQQHLGGGKVRAVALGSTDGLRRGLDCVDTGGSVTVPVGKETLGRVFNLLGDLVCFI